MDNFELEKIDWHRIEGGKYDKNKIWAKMPIKPDYIPDMKGKVYVYKYKYDYDENGNIDYSTEKLVDYQVGDNKVVKWAKIPLSFMIAGCIYKIGDAWNDGYNIATGKGAGRTKGLDGSGVLNDPNLWKKAFVVPSDYVMYNSSGAVVNNLMLWNPNGNSSGNYAQFPFFPTKIRLGISVPANEVAEQTIADDQSRLYEYAISSNNFEGQGREVPINNGYYIFSTEISYKQFIYATRPQPLNDFSYFSANNLWFNSSPDVIQDRSVYISTNNGLLSAISIKAILPTHDPNGYYCYNNMQIGQLELRCDAGSRNLIDNSGSNVTHYTNMLDGIVYSIKNIGVTTKEPNTKLVFNWILYF